MEETKQRGVLSVVMYGKHLAESGSEGRRLKKMMMMMMIKQEKMSGKGRERGKSLETGD